MKDHLILERYSLVSCLCYQIWKFLRFQSADLYKYNHNLTNRYKTSTFVVLDRSQLKAVNFHSLVWSIYSTTNSCLQTMFPMYNYLLFPIYMEPFTIVSNRFFWVNRILLRPWKIADTDMTNFEIADADMNVF